MKLTNGQFEETELQDEALKESYSFTFSADQL